MDDIDLLLVHYEDLERDTLDAISKIFRFLKINYTDRQLSMATADLNTQLKLLDTKNMEDVLLNEQHKERIRKLTESNHVVYGNYLSKT